MLPEIIQVGDPILRKTCRPIKPEELASAEMTQLVADLRDVIRSAKMCALAAPQLGQAVRMVAVEDRLHNLSGAAPAVLAELQREPIPFHVLVNPVLVVEDPTPVEAFEGCASMPWFVAAVPRALGVRVDALDEHAERRTIHARAWYARLLQHEIDHLDGRLYTDLMLPWSLTSFENRRRFWADVKPAEMLARMGR